ncbi:M20/M25/M40 family metallo-hydrolase [Microbacterium sp. STN6]|uniref:M20/M25/M40 family metallo-hydrolase n=1 Tax=Microbacterium sp. STN6 TaxID=2995588 RepID=UPI0022608BD0|nr:M20/M25/M40 family metallo-hydrolase [Microbacterium sp. STN6]MCX7521571.1 M20/M25/M40 family metallo-hydrolase [Microbacterium sp. STN6]
MTADSAASPLEETAAIARDLIRFDTTNYGRGRSNGETDAAEYVEAQLRRLGLTPRLFDSDPGRTSVISRVEGADHSKPALVVHGHLDVVPADASNWSVDPFAGEIIDGMLWGRGAVDMKDMDAMILTALGDILGSGRRPARDLVIAFFADEEDGGLLGSHYLVKNHPELFAGATEAISEVGGYSIDIEGKRAYLLQTGEKSLIWIRLVTRGKAAHGSRLIRENAVTRLAEAVAAVGRREWPIRLTQTTTQLVGELGRILGADPQQAGPDALVLRTGTAAGFILATLRTTTNPTQLTAGYKHNVIPEMAEALIDIRTLPGEEDEVLAEVRGLVGDDVEVETVHRDIGLEAPLEGALVTAITDALGRHDPGAPVLPYLMSGGTDNKALSLLGIDGYGFAPLRLPAELDFPGMFHGVDERVPLDALVFGRKVLADLLLRY